MSSASVRSALVVGIDKYQDGRRLTAAAADATGIAGLLRRDGLAGLPNWSVALMTDTGRGDVVGAAQLRNAVSDLLTSKRGHDVLLYFAGHAVRTPWGSQLQAYDGSALSFNDLLSLINQSRASTVTVILDCCVSSDLGNEAEPADTDPFHVDRALLRENLSILSASLPFEEAQETHRHGAFTKMLLGGLEGAAAELNGTITVLALYSHAAAAFGGHAQRPTLKSHVVHPVVLRQVEPLVSLERLARIVDLFPTEDHAVALTMHHEGVPEDSGFFPRGDDYPAFGGSAAQVDLDHLKEWRGIRLVEAENRRDFFFLCVNGGTVSLTPLGRYYRRLVAAGVY